MIKELKAYALAHHVPIICDDGLLFLEKTIVEHDIKHVLEIGSAIGYSAIAMALFGIKVDTIERDDQMFARASENILKAQLSQKIKCIHADAITYNHIDQRYDMIFIDAAKSQYKHLFNKYEPFLKPDGIIVCDNLYFHHLDPDKVNRNTRQLLRKINEFSEFLKNHATYETTFYDVGDGMSLSKRKAI